MSILTAPRVHFVGTMSWDHFLNAGQSSPVSVRVYQRGQSPSVPLKVVTRQYLGLQPTDADPIESVVTGDGLAGFDLPASEPGVADFAMKVVTLDETSVEFPQQLDITAGQFFSTRILPTDEELEQNTNDADLTWQFIYDRVLRNWDLVNPIMSLRGLPLNDEATLRDVKDRILEVIQWSRHESPEYMPITRDLSAGKRRLLERWLAVP